MLPHLADTADKAEDPVLPDYGGPCISNVLPALLARQEDEEPPSWLPTPVLRARQVVLLALDGLGWEQLRERTSLAPALTQMHGQAVTTVVPSTTATCLTSLTTGVPPGRHGVVGYRVHVGGGDVLNILRWRVPSGDARDAVPPSKFAPIDPFLGMQPATITRAEFEGGPFSEAHLRGSRFFGWRVTSTIVTHVRQLLRDGEPLIYAYYDGIDKVAHEYGLGEFYDAELTATDRLVADLLEALPGGAVLVVTSDHGQVHVGDRLVSLDPAVLQAVEVLSGEGRFRWLHARPGAAGALAEAARACHGDQAWVRTRDEAVAEGWFGEGMSAAAESRLGDVLLAASQPVAFLDPADTGEVRLVSRHGSVTSAEMFVPLLAASG